MDGMVQRRCGVWLRNAGPLVVLVLPDRVDWARPRHGQDKAHVRFAPLRALTQGRGHKANALISDGLLEH